MSGTTVERGLKPVPNAMVAGFLKMAERFRPFHKDTLNVALHLLTTPLGILAVFGLVGQPSISIAATAVYLASLWFRVTTKAWIGTSSILVILNAISFVTPMSFYISMALLLVSYFGQDLSHYICGEPTFQSTYEDQPNFWETLAEHTYYLLPLVVDSMDHMDGSFFAWFVPQRNMLQGKFKNPEELDDLNMVRTWVRNQNPSKDVTTHWWFRELPLDTKNAFDRVTKAHAMKSMFNARFPDRKYNVDVLPGMNEIYVACLKHHNDSDTVFYMNHVDGPMQIFPFCFVYRCLVAVTENTQIETAFPQVPKTCCLTTGDVCALDFHREVHRIQQHPKRPNKDYRVVLKIHYVVYPKIFGALGRFYGVLTTSYNWLFRHLFNNTKTPEGIFWNFMGMMVILVTDAWLWVEANVGINNIFITLLLSLGNLLHPSFFLATTSFVHYTKYICTYYYRDVTFGAFKRDVMFWKFVSIGQIVAYYLQSMKLTGWEIDTVSLAMIIVGYGIAIQATRAIGVDRTYFGAELGLLKPKWINTFPYGTVPHPMICGAVIGLLGFHKLASFRAAFPWLVPAHVILYTIHCLQEIYDVHDPKTIKFSPVEDKEERLAVTGAKAKLKSG